MMTYSFACQSVTSSASTGSTDLPQHGRLFLTEPTSVDRTPVALEEPNPSLDATEQRSGLDDRDKKSRFGEHVFRGGEE